SIQNTSNTPNNVKRVVTGIFIRQPGSEFTVTRATIPDTLAPGETMTAEVSFLPKKEIVYNADICFIIAAPCPDTICVPLKGTGIKSNILVRQSTLDFGTLYSCEDST